MRAKNAENVLLTIPISHYCEKARWALERVGVAYRERAHVQAIHRLAALRAGGGLTVPVFVCAEGVLADSEEILAWADRRAPAGRELYPSDHEQAAEVRRLETDFNAGLGPQGRCWMYQQLRERRDLAISYGCAGVPAWERTTLRVAYPLLIAIVAHVLDVTPTTAANAEIQVRTTFDEIGKRLADGRPYLCGERFTAADLTFAALAAPMLMPAGYGVALPPTSELPPHAAKVVRELRAHPAGVHASAMYAQERRPPPAQAGSPRS
jgi:glutathione S-transferase